MDFWIIGLHQSIDPMIQNRRDENAKQGRRASQSPPQSLWFNHRG
jgi:hypothetical protein